MLGLRQTYNHLRSANGVGQTLIYAFWGILLAGMFYDMCPQHLPNSLVVFWGVVSAIIIPTLIWMPKIVLKYLLILDFFLSGIIASIILTHEPHSIPSVYMTNTLTGFVEAHRQVTPDILVSELFQTAALIWMTLHAGYLADLTHRQILERKRWDVRS